MYPLQEHEQKGKGLSRERHNINYHRRTFPESAEIWEAKLYHPTQKAKEPKGRLPP